MKKVLFSVALFMAASVVSAQESVVKEAKANKNDPAKAAQILEPALVNPETANDPETWKLAGDFQKAIYDAENLKMFVPGNEPADTAKFYSSLEKMYEYYLKCDEVEQAQVKSGELKKPKLRKKIVKTLVEVRPNLTAGGSEAFNTQRYGDALKFFSMYVDGINNPIFEEEVSVKNDSLVNLIACYATMAANQVGDRAAVIKYGNIGKSNKEEGYRALMCISEISAKSENPDSTQWLAAVKEGCERFPEQDYFIGSLMDYYIQKNMASEGLTTIEKVIASRGETPYLLYVKGMLQFETKNYEGAIATFNALIAKNSDFVGEAYAKIGDCYFYPAQEYVLENSELSMDDPKFAVNEDKIKAEYEKARPFYEKAKVVAPSDKQLWGSQLLNIYWKLNKAEYDALEKELSL